MNVAGAAVSSRAAALTVPATRLAEPRGRRSASRFHFRSIGPISRPDVHLVVNASGLFPGLLYDGRTWDRTRDLSRVKRALSR
jgi:hypothetical protein